jgi:hypothetical protein
MFGLFNAGFANEYLEYYRIASSSKCTIVRDAAAYGLGASTDAADERRLWTLIHDKSSDVRLSAAYSLRDMPRKIDSNKYFHAIKALKFGSHLLLAERAIRDRRLFRTTRNYLIVNWPMIRRRRWTSWVENYPRAFGFTG